MRTDRLNEMEQYVIQHGTATLPELTEHFGISTNTVRRDVNSLVLRGKINKVYGGVSANNTLAFSPLLPFQERASMNRMEKQIIGKMAATLVQDNTAIFLDSGSTTPCMLPYLAEKNNITIVTHSLIIQYEAAKYPSLNVLSLGGMFNHSTASFMCNGDHLLRKIHLQTLFMAASAVSPKWGAGNNTYDEFKIKEDITHRYENIVLLIDSSKFDKTASYAFCSFSSLSAIVTERMPSKHILDAINACGIRLYCPETEQR